MTNVIISAEPITFDELVSVARHGAKVALCDATKEKINASRESVERMIKNKEIVYGITTGFGSFYNKTINPEQVEELQRNLIVSHAAGVGDPLPGDVVRAMMLLRVKSLSHGFSGIRLEVVEKLLEMLNKGIVPHIPEKGSLGASGDLCPLSHMALPLLGKGEAYFNGKLLPGDEAMKAAGIETIELKAKEGLALNNGTQCMTAIGALAVYDAEYLLETAEKSASLTLEALNGRLDAFDPRIHEKRNQVGQVQSAEKIRKHTEGSEYLLTPGTKNARVQDAYTLRCIAQVHGASRDALSYIKSVVFREMNAVTDNPLIFPEDDGATAISGGNFHGQPIALVMDFLGIAVAELGNISERRLERLVNKDLSNGLPAYLTDTDKGGLHSGFMIVQYTSAALVSENKILAHPASVDSIPSSNNQEDHVSMGTIAARKAAAIIKNVRRVIAMELLAAAQAIDLRNKGVTPQNLGKSTKAVYNTIRENVPPMFEDRVIAPDVKKVSDLIKERKF